MVVHTQFSGFLYTCSTMRVESIDYSALAGRHCACVCFVSYAITWFIAGVFLIISVRDVIDEPCSSWDNLLYQTKFTVAMHTIVTILVILWNTVPRPVECVWMMWIFIVYLAAFMTYFTTSVAVAMVMMSSYDDENMKDCMESDVAFPLWVFTLVYNLPMLMVYFTVIGGMAIALGIYVIGVFIYSLWIIVSVLIVDQVIFLYKRFFPTRNSEPDLELAEKD